MHVEPRDDGLFAVESLQRDRGSLCSRFSGELNPLTINPLSKIDHIARLRLGIRLLDRGERSRLIPRPRVIAARRHIKLRGCGKAGKKHEGNRDEEVSLGFHGMEETGRGLGKKVMRTC